MMAYEFELDIVQGFYETDDKRGYIEACAENYNLTVEDVRGILIEGGVDARKLPRAKRGKKNAVAAESIKGGEPEDPVFDAVMEMLDAEVEKVKEGADGIGSESLPQSASLTAPSSEGAKCAAAGEPVCFWETEETLRQMELDEKILTAVERAGEMMLNNCLEYIEGLKAERKRLKEELEQIEDKMDKLYGCLMG